MLCRLLALSVCLLLLLSGCASEKNTPDTYIGISHKLTEPGNEKKLENAVKLLALLFSPEGQDTCITDQPPCVLSVLSNDPVPEDSLIYDAQQAMWNGRAFPMTYEHWDNVLTDMGQAYNVQVVNRRSSCAPAYVPGWRNRVQFPLMGTPGNKHTSESMRGSLHAGMKPLDRIGKVSMNET